MIAHDGIIQRAKISGALFTLSTGVDRFSGRIRYFFNLGEVNMRYQENNLRLSRELYRYRTIVEQSDHISSASALSADITADTLFSFIPAKVIMNSTNKLHNSLVVNKGRRDGIEPDMGVISSDGIVGIISSVSENYSYVISLLDINQKLSARIVSSNAAGTISWDGRSMQKVTLVEVPLHININQNDTVATSGFSSRFPANIPIGTIESSSQIQGTHHKIEVRIFQDFSTLRYVNIVRNNHRNEIDSLLIRSNE